MAKLNVYTLFIIIGSFNQTHSLFSSSESEEDEGNYATSSRRRAARNVTYNMKEYDDMIKSAIADNAVPIPIPVVDASAAGAVIGGPGKGKDIGVVEEEEEEKEQVSPLGLISSSSLIIHSLIIIITISH